MQQEKERRGGERSAVLVGWRGGGLRPPSAGTSKSGNHKHHAHFRCLRLPDLLAPAAARSAARQPRRRSPFLERRSILPFSPSPVAFRTSRCRTELIPVDRNQVPSPPRCPSFPPPPAAPRGACWRLAWWR